jgi:hypothetical protein
MSRRLAMLAYTALSLGWPATSLAQPTVWRDTLAFWVIGPDSATRQWTSEWIERTLRAAATRPQVPIVAWRRALPRLLDVDAPSALGDPPADEARGGPGPLPDPNAHYPWDMTQPLSVRDMIERLHDQHLGVIVQVVVRRYSAESASAADSVYGLEALALAEKGQGVRSRQIITLIAASNIEHRSLREAGRLLGERLAVVWFDITAGRPVRAR